MDSGKAVGRWLGGPIVGMALILALGACSARGTQPDDMSAVAHRQRAQDHATKAREDAARYDASATQIRRVDSLSGADNSIGVSDWENYNPTAWYRTSALRHRGHADAHRKAAGELERFEAHECSGIEAAIRSACPLLGAVVAVREVPHGVHFDFQRGIDIDKLTAHLRCHAAYARAQGRKGMPGCPLYIKGLKVQRSGEHGITLTTDDDADVESLRTRAIRSVVR